MIKFNGANNRRSFLSIASFSFFSFGLSSIGLSQFLKSFSPSEGFVSIYRVNLSELISINNNLENVLSSISISKLLFPDFEKSWYTNYDQVKLKYIQENRLFLSQRKFSIKDKSVSYINYWKSEEDFKSFCAETRMYELHNRFLSSNCHPQFTVMGSNFLRRA